jgi:hypothetical protein
MSITYQTAIQDITTAPFVKWAWEKGNINFCEKLAIKRYMIYTKLVTAHLKIQFSLYFLHSLHLQVEWFKNYMGRFTYGRLCCVTTSSLCLWQYCTNISGWLTISKYDSVWIIITLHVLQVSFPNSQSHCTYQSQSNVIFHEVRMNAFVFYAMKSLFNHVMHFMPPKILYLTENNLTSIFMPSEVISCSYYWHFNQTGTVHSKWIPVFHDGLITPVHLYSDMYCTCSISTHNILHIFWECNEFT